LQVYGIIASQLVLTAIVAGTILASPPVRSFVTSSIAFQVTFALLPLVGKINPSMFAMSQVVTNQTMLLVTSWLQECWSRR
jgi:uncharacterized membrane protein